MIQSTLGLLLIVNIHRSNPMKRLTTWQTKHEAHRSTKKTSIQFVNEDENDNKPR